MIKNLWKNTKFVCMCHDPVVKFQYQQGHAEINQNASMFYSCPKYYPENRDKIERACSNRLNFNDAEAIINKVSDIIETDIRNNKFINYEGYKFKHKTIECKILHYSEDKLTIGIINKKAMR